MKDQKNQIVCFKMQVCYHPNPTEVFNQLCGQRHETLLLESSEINNKHNIESMMIIDSALRITAYNTIVTIQTLTKNGASLISLLQKKLPDQIKINKTCNGIKLIFPIINQWIDEDTRLKSISIFDCLRTLLKILQPRTNVPKSIFLGGLFSYDLVSYFEPLPKFTNYLNCPDYCFYLAETLLILDHRKSTAELQSTLFNLHISEEKDRLKKRMDQLKEQIKKTQNTIPYKKVNNMILRCDQNDEKYIKNLCKIQELIRQGEIFQAVPSRRFFLPCPSPLASYHALKNENPSPYMFFMQDKIFTLFGASPESSLKYNSKNRQIEIYPIAGTRSRAYHIKDKSLDKDTDNRIELEMRLNHKELSEHLMLVDLARNDLARVCTAGSRYVSDLLKVDRYSYVMHLVSRVIGELRYDFDALHAYRACMNMGTLTGAPKIRAMQLIYEIEKTRRNTYGGAIGYLTGSGNLDTCIIIRSAYVTNQIATIQAGAGIVIDSIPQLEADESRKKAKAVLKAISSAHCSKVIY